MRDLETQLEIDFVEWLSELSVDEKIENLCWLETPDGDANGDEFCHDCAEKEVKKNLLAAEKFEKCERCKGKGKHKDILGEKMEECEDCYGTGRVCEDEYTEICGDGGSATETDHQPSCESCGVALLCSPTRHMIEQEIEWLQDTKEMGTSSALSFREWLTGMGDYQREIDWPKIKPHAKRLMKAAGREIAPEGKIRVCLSDAFTQEYYAVRKCEWTLVYQWLATRLVKYADGESILEYLIDASGTGHYCFNDFDSPEQPHRAIAKLLEHVGEPKGRGAFLKSIGFSNRSDLDKPFLIPDERFDWPTMDVRGRVFKRPGPNSCHPEARTVTHAKFGIGKDGLWSYDLYYDFNHWDRSSWCKSIRQKKCQSLPKFMDAIAKWMKEALEPDHPNGSGSRMAYLRDWDAAMAGIKAVFSFDYAGKYDHDVELADLLTTSLCGGIPDKHIRIKEGDGRFETLKKWIEEDKAAHAKSRAEWEARRR